MQLYSPCLSIMTNHQRLFHTSVEPQKKFQASDGRTTLKPLRTMSRKTPCACEVKDKLVSSWIGYWHIDTTLDRPPEKTWWSNFETMINLLTYAWKSMVNNGDHSSSNIRLSKSAWKKYKPAIDLVPDSDLDGFLWICTDLHLAWKISVPDQKSVPKRKDLPRPMSQEVEETLSLYMSTQIAVRISGKTNRKPFRSLSSFCTVSFLKSDYANTSPKN